ncbi:MAG TPA: signal peptidase I [Ktedonobacterales bacterium]
MADETTQPTAGQTAEVHVVVEQRSRAGCCLGRIVGALVTVFILFIILANAIAPYRIGGPSMQPTLHDGQTLFAHTDTFLGVNFHAPARGTIVLYHPPKDTSKTLVGRVIAIPGDTIEVTSDAVILNGQTLNEKYIQGAPTGQAQNPQGQTVAPTKLGTNQYFIMGDNRPNSFDSRKFGLVPFDHIISEVWIILG